MTPQVYSGQVPEDVGGTPFSDGREPDDDQDRGGWDEEFASVVFDEDFVQAAKVHEPTAVERLLAAAQARAEAQEAEARRARIRRGPDDDFYDDTDPDGYGLDGSGDFGRELDDLYDDELDRPGRPGAFAARVRWRRPVAWALALLMGIGMVALAFTAVYRGASAGRQDDRVPPPATTELEKSLPGPSASADYSRPAVSAVPRTP
ncbi:hypothetical protein [Streptomyces sp. VRA16 Mangrove soil]|uniref:SCO2584 family spore wall biosynthesis protein n=1 Tax=Streptomyces sp. VRA16 Mangrove soil TaxID=2817434 RepID=UPI001A9F32E1|nr:hypothetical protein [Streptomyces sp. VRA16 Mangrove soil]MBO1333935.1 hypothetical protein [Streptomyces sp. VRA16 Mangrove soil]